jgi:hypothetical protein
MNLIIRAVVFVVSALPLAAQATFPLLINAGGPAVGNFLADQCLNGAVWTPANDPAMGTMTDVYQTLRYGTAMSCTIPVASNGVYSVALLMLEPNKTGPNQRVFSVTVNGQTTGPLDLFAMTGGKLIPYEVDFLMFAPERQITISFRASVGNAVVSAIIVRGGGNPGPAAIASTWAVWSEQWIGLFYRDTVDGTLKVIDAGGMVTALISVAQAAAAIEQQRYTAALAFAKAHPPQ